MTTALPGSHEFANLVAELNVRVAHYDHADAVSNKVTIPVEAGAFVLAVAHLVEEAFAGGTPSVKIGDGTDDDGFLALAATPLDAINKFASSLGAGGMSAVTTADTWTPNPFSAGKYYATAGAVVVTLSGSLTAGKGSVHILSYQTKGNWRKPAL